MYGSWSTVYYIYSRTEETKDDENGGCRNGDTEIPDRRQRDKKQQRNTEGEPNGIKCRINERSLENGGMMTMCPIAPGQGVLINAQANLVRQPSNTSSHRTAS